MEIFQEPDKVYYTHDQLSGKEQPLKGGAGNKFLSLTLDVAGVHGLLVDPLPELRATLVSELGELPQLVKDSVKIVDSSVAGKQKVGSSNLHTLKVLLMEVMFHINDDSRQKAPGLNKFVRVKCELVTPTLTLADGNRVKVETPP